MPTKAHSGGRIRTSDDSGMSGNAETMSFHTTFGGSSELRTELDELEQQQVGLLPARTVRTAFGSAGGGGDAIGGDGDGFVGLSDASGGFGTSGATGGNITINI